jgi:hypothetical protein
MADSTMLLTALANFQASLECMIENNQEKMDEIKERSQKI